LDYEQIIGQLSALAGPSGFEGEIAQAAAERGAEVTLVSGPVAIPAPQGVRVVQVRTACEMLAACESVFPDVDIALFSAAVADMRPVNPAGKKLKKGVDDEALSRIELMRNPDILATCGAVKRPGQVVVGFAAETDDVVAYAQAKLASKNADFMVANDVSEGRVFGSDENEAFLVSAEEVVALPAMSKADLAGIIIDKAVRSAGDAQGASWGD